MTPRIHVPERTPEGRPFTANERKIILAAELYQRSKGEAASWAELQRAVGCSRTKFKYVMKGLRGKGLISFDDSPRSLRVNPKAVTMALERGRSA